MPSCAPPMPATAPCGCALGMVYTHGSSDAVAGAVTACPPSSRAACCASTSSICRGPTAGARRPCGCGGEETVSLTSSCASGPTCDASTSNTPTASPRTPWDGQHRVCAHQSKPTAGRGSSWPRSPSCASLVGSLTTYGSPGNVRSIQGNSLRHAFGEVFVGFVPHSAHRPVHRNPIEPDRGDPKARPLALDSAIPSSRRRREEVVRV